MLPCVVVQVITKKEMNLMASQHHLDLLSSGKTLWDTWRRKYSDVQAFEPDLHGADLHKADLRRADLHRTDLTEANLREADLRHTNLRGANLNDANLLKARLHG